MVLVGLTGTAALAAASVPNGRQLLAVVAGIPVVTWLALGLLDRWLDETECGPEPMECTP